MIIPDVNLLLYAYNKSAKRHNEAKEWWTNLLNGDETVGLPLVVLFSFLRISTNPKAFAVPLTPEEAIQRIQSWLDRPMVRLLEQAYHQKVFDLLKELGTAGNLVTDAQIAAIALEENAVLHSADFDFGRFPKLKHVNPLRMDDRPAAKD